MVRESPQHEEQYSRITALGMLRTPALESFKKVWVKKNNIIKDLRALKPDHLEPKHM